MIAKIPIQINLGLLSANIAIGLAIAHSKLLVEILVAAEINLDNLKLTIREAF